MDAQWTPSAVPQPSTLSENRLVDQWRNINFWTPHPPQVKYISHFLDYYHTEFLNLRIPSTIVMKILWHSAEWLPTVCIIQYFAAHGLITVGLIVDCMLYCNVGQFISRNPAGGAPIRVLQGFAGRGIWLILSAGCGGNWGERERGAGPEPLTRRCIESFFVLDARLPGWSLFSYGERAPNAINGLADQPLKSPFPPDFVDSQFARARPLSGQQIKHN